MIQPGMKIRSVNTGVRQAMASPRPIWAALPFRLMSAHAMRASTTMIGRATTGKKYGAVVSSTQVMNSSTRALIANAPKVARL